MNDYDSMIGALTAEFLDQETSGKNPNLEEFILRCPVEHRAELRAALSLIRRVGPTGNLIPLEIGFDIREEVGQGSFGRVFRALDKALQREVALKVIANTGPWIGARDRFLLEARLLASLRHPNIVQIYSIDEEAGRIRLSLEYVHGKNLHQFLAEHGPFAAEEAARIACDLARALAALHSKQLVHRDLKPSNIMREEGGRIVLLDFGLARSTSPDTQTDRNVAGTPSVMAPEQFDPDREVGPSADIYALGVLLYWMVTGVFPFLGESVEDLSEKVRSGQAVPLTDHRSTIPTEFVAIVRRAMAVREEDRFRSAGELEEALRHFLAGSAAKKKNRKNHLIAAVVVLFATGLFFNPWTEQKANLSLGLQANLYAIRAGKPALLRSGDEVFLEDKIYLEINLAQSAYIYIFNEDAAGHAYALFPMKDYELQNPVPAGKGVRLPGKSRGSEISWVIDSQGGGAEKFLIVAAAKPDSMAEALWKELPQPQEKVGRSYNSLSESTRHLIQRGAGLVKKVSSSSGLQAGSIDTGRVSAYFPEIEGEFVLGESIRKTIRLRNQGEER